MEFIFTFRGMDSSDAIRQYAEKKFSRLEKYFYGPVEVQVIFKREKFREIVEVNMTGDGERIIAKEETQDIYEAIDLAYESLEKQVKKLKEKKKSFRKGRGSRASEPASEERYLVKTVEITPLSTQEAFKWFENQNKGFFLFFNTDYDRICAIYYEGDKPIMVIPELG